MNTSVTTHQITLNNRSRARVGHVINTMSEFTAPIVSYTVSALAYCLPKLPCIQW